jgi:hypothetical protein
VRARFGDEAARAAFGEGETGVEAYEDALIQVDGTVATAVRTIGTRTHQLFLKEVGGRWYVDLSRAARRDELVQRAPQMRSLGEVYAELRRGVETGWYKSAAQVRAAIEEYAQEIERAGPKR